MDPRADCRPPAADSDPPVTACEGVRGFDRYGEITNSTVTGNIGFDRYGGMPSPRYSSHGSSHVPGEAGSLRNVRRPAFSSPWGTPWRPRGGSRLERAGGSPFWCVLAPDHRTAAAPEGLIHGELPPPRARCCPCSGAGGRRRISPPGPVRLLVCAHGMPSNSSYQDVG